MNNQAVTNLEQKLNIGMTVESIPYRTDIEYLGSGAKHYRIKLVRGDAVEIIYYSMGSGLNYSPILGEVLASIFQDAQASEYGFEEFCDNFGYDNDSIKALKIYKECQKARGKFYRLFPDVTHDELYELLQSYL